MRSRHGLPWQLAQLAAQPVGHTDQLVDGQQLPRRAPLLQTLWPMVPSAQETQMESSKRLVFQTVPGMPRTTGRASTTGSKPGRASLSGSPCSTDSRSSGPGRPHSWESIPNSTRSLTSR
jgi:hypothetical protein